MIRDGTEMKKGKEGKQGRYVEFIDGQADKTSLYIFATRLQEIEYTDWYLMIVTCTEEKEEN